MGFRDPTPVDLVDELVAASSNSLTWLTNGAIKTFVLPGVVPTDYEVIEVDLTGGSSGPGGPGLGMQIVNTTRGTVSMVQTLPPPDLVTQSRQFFIPILCKAGDKLSLTYRSTTTAQTLNVGIYGHTAPVVPMPLRPDARLQVFGRFSGYLNQAAAGAGTLIIAPQLNVSVLLKSLQIASQANAVGNAVRISGTIGGGAVNLASVVNSASASAGSQNTFVDFGPNGKLLDPGTGVLTSLSQAGFVDFLADFDLVF
jgi:hypothetical protein